MDPKTLPQIAYEAYAEYLGWKSYQGLPIPRWVDLRQNIQEAWGAATHAVCDAIVLPNL